MRPTILADFSIETVKGEHMTTVMLQTLEQVPQIFWQIEI